MENQFNFSGILRPCSTNYISHSHARLSGVSTCTGRANQKAVAPSLAHLVVRSDA